MQHQLIFKSKFDVSDTGTFTGYLSVAGNVDGQGDRVVAGAFARDLAENGPKRPLCWQHHMDEVIGTVLLAEDARGLYVTKGTLVLDVQRGREAYALLRAGAIDAMSIGYSTEEERYRQGVRELTRIRLYEGSLVTVPANALARIDEVKRHGDERELRALLDAMRSMNLAITNERDRREAESLRSLLSDMRNFRRSLR